MNTHRQHTNWSTTHINTNSSATYKLAGWWWYRCQWQNSTIILIDCDWSLVGFCVAGGFLCTRNARPQNDVQIFIKSVCYILVFSIHINFYRRDQHFENVTNTNAIGKHVMNAVNTKIPPAHVHSSWKRESTCMYKLAHVWSEIDHDDTRRCNRIRMPSTTRSGSLYGPTHCFTNAGTGWQSMCPVQHQYIM